MLTPLGKAVAETLESRDILCMDRAVAEKVYQNRNANKAVEHYRPKRAEVHPRCSRKGEKIL